MAEWWSLSSLACRPPDAARTVAWQSDAQHLSHADLLVRTGCWQRALAQQPQSHCALYLNDPFEFAAALLAAWHAGKTVVIPGDDRPDTVHALRAAGHLLVGDLPAALQACPDDAGATAWNRQALNPSAARMRLYTSGSQGQPEAIDKRLDQLVSELDALEEAFGKVLAGPAAENAQPIVWTTVSHQHIYGLLFLVLWPLAAGRPFGLRRLLYPQDLAACLGACASVLVSTPAHLRRLSNPPDWTQARQQLRGVFSSGGPLPFEVSRFASTVLGQTPIEVFGSSETGGIAWRQCTSAQDPWQLFSDVQWRLDGACLTVRSPRLPDAQWWTTSDRAEPAGPHGFRLLGRADRIVKIEEKRVSLSTIEQQLLKTPWVQEAKALVVDTPVGARVGVVAVLTPAGREQQASRSRRVWLDLLRHALAHSVQAVALPKRWRFVDALPVNAQGKSPESLLRALFTAQTADRTRAPERPEMPAVHWLQRSATESLATLDIHSGLTVFDGHFEVAPILPGVAQLDWALTLGRECFAIPPRFVRLETLKFFRPVQPGTVLYLALQFRPHLADAVLCSLGFRLYSHDAATQSEREHASGRSIWSHAPGAVHA
ncbi:AMP-dependent synthetase [Verminephrobacter aporrectodeae subsp. tuberculatae]|uniref:AMP-binding protein n=1 Tax=Verminephrobacter aporrectodeae TaxID=1110389 RepID=UPI0022435FEE|nr:AMP-binding protein [Verminephrobacter aporrectodeae]MCW8198942.1 AMP-dependent synthetase [Verminephrobacter aporrectodeae subsp. tuberculatae]